MVTQRFFQNLLLWMLFEFCTILHFNCIFVQLILAACYRNDEWYEGTIKLSINHGVSASKFIHGFNGEGNYSRLHGSEPWWQFLWIIRTLLERLIIFTANGFVLQWLLLFQLIPPKPLLELQTCQYSSSPPLRHSWLVLSRSAFCSFYLPGRCNIGKPGSLSWYFSSCEMRRVKIFFSSTVSDWENVESLFCETISERSLW